MSPLKLSLGLGVSATVAGVWLAQEAPSVAARLTAPGRGIETPLQATAHPPLPQTLSDRPVSSPWTTTIEPDRLGQFRTEMEVDGRMLAAIVDTGASYVALSSEAAEIAGLRVPASAFTAVVQTANGTARAAPVVLPRVRVGNVEARDVEALVTEPGALTGVSLLGMSFLRKLSGYQVQSGRLLLQQ